MISVEKYLARAQGDVRNPATVKLQMAPTVHPYAREARRVHDIAGLTGADIAGATGAAPSTARAWLAGTRKPTDEHADRLIELSALVERLQRVMDSSYIPVWLRRPIEALDDREPLDLLADGEFREVARVISSLEDAPFT
jgi:transcriptional regulator with XRE-family HTH domain